jgi:hypothetical protein
MKNLHNKNAATRASRRPLGEACGTNDSGLRANSYLEIAPTGQASSQEPQSTHFSALISYCVSPWSIASTGHCAAQAPQLTQSLLILYAMIKTSNMYVLDTFFKANAIVTRLNEKSSGIFHSARKRAPPPGCKAHRIYAARGRRALHKQRRAAS